MECQGSVLDFYRGGEATETGDREAGSQAVIDAAVVFLPSEARAHLDGTLVSVF
jgi:hypothetical protein